MTTTMGPTLPVQASLDADSLSTAVVNAIADAEGVDPTELEPLYETVNPDALDALFRPVSDGDRRTGRATFRMNGYEVVATSSGRVHLTELDQIEE